MYWHAKIILIIVALLITGIFIYSFRSFIPDLPSFTKKSQLSEPKNTKTIQTPNLSAKAKLEKRKEASGNSHGKTIINQKLAKAREMFQSDELLKARKITENILLDPKLEPFSSDWLIVAELLSEINTKFLFTGAMCPEKITYTVVKNDSLVKIANRFNTTVGLIQKSNELDPTNSMIYPNQLFRIYKADWNIKVFKDLFLLLLSDKDRLVKVYKIGIGRQDRTPVGTFVIEVKEFEPDWWQPGRLVKFGDPENVLGTRWMSLTPIENTNPALRGYGIHGTWEPESIGHAASLGCVRMVNDTVEELYNIVPVGTRVVIVDSVNE